MLLPITAAPHKHKILILEQRRCHGFKPCAPLGLDHPVIRRDLEIPCHDHVPKKCHIHLTGTGLPKGFQLGSKAQRDQCHIR